MKEKKLIAYHTICFRCTDEELKKYNEAAKKDNRTLSNYIRTKLLK